MDSSATFTYNTRNNKNILDVNNATDIDFENMVQNQGTETERVIVDEVKEIWMSNCYYENLDLRMFTNLELLYCSNCIKMIDYTWRGLRRLQLPHYLLNLHCEGNMLETLELPHEIMEVDAQANNLRSVSFFTEDGTVTDEPQYLQSLNLENNYIESLHFKVPSSLDVVKIGYNGSTGSMLTIPDVDPAIAKIAKRWDPPLLY